MEVDSFKKPASLSTPTKSKTVEDHNRNEENEKLNSPDTIKSEKNQSEFEKTTTECSFNCPYKVPKWSSTPPSNVEYKFEILKSGQIIEKIENLEKKPYWVFGRLPGSDIHMAHPTISRYHAVLQYRPKTDSGKDNDEKVCEKEIEEGWYIYDLDSTHGTFLNKQRIPAKVYIRIKVGHMLKLGTSTRSYILFGPTSDEEPESQLSVTELRQKRIQEEEKQILDEKRQEEEREKEGISWGMAEDADEETDLSINPYAILNEELFLDDPKKTLRGFYEREGIPLEYKCDEIATGSFVCSVELPIDDSNGRPIVAEISHKGRKKECVAQCALEACRILDKHGVLRQANHEPLKRKIRTSDSDDDDDFLDRTGDIERKKLRKVNSGSNVTLTYLDLLEKEKELLEKIKIVDENITKYQQLSKRIKENKSENENDLDSFMENLDDDANTLDKTEIRKLRVEQQRLNVDKQRLEKLIKLAKPIDLLSIPLETPKTSSSKIKASNTNKTLPLIGKRNQFKFSSLKSAPKAKNSTENPWKSDEEEIEEEGNEDADKKEKNPETINKEIEMELQVTSEKQKLIDTSSEVDESKKSNIELEIAKNDKDNSTPNDNLSKKSRHRQRNRHRRNDVDIDDLAEHDIEEKYAKWVPPENQTGDGITELNKKFGY